MNTNTATDHVLGVSDDDIVRHTNLFYCRLSNPFCLLTGGALDVQIVKNVSAILKLDIQRNHVTRFRWFQFSLGDIAIIRASGQQREIGCVWRCGLVIKT
ncbi:hypothetical protein AAJCM20276_27350 [Acetobacter aceti]|uniref:Uncharacterized protein n=1 Tax=Acetobacter aceti TaxID=435 RepID=A0A6S6PN44_ACEAC|nr:hypothetical protein AAJCM20276_27350 [Acetobacter aceti]